MNQPPLSSTISRLRGRTRLLGITSSLLLAILAAAIVLIAWAWIDLLLDASPALRLAGCIGAALVFIAILAFHIRLVIQYSTDARLARRLDAAASARGQIISGFDLQQSLALSANGPPNTPDLSAGLASLAGDRAARLAAAAPLDKAAPARTLFRFTAALAILALIILLVAAINPRLVSTQFSRILHPFTDQPAFSQVQIDVEPGNASVVYGGDLEIRASAKGGAVDRLETILIAPTGEEEILPMFAESDGHWRTALANVTASAKYFVRAYQAKSSRFDIRVLTVPKITAVSARVTSPAYSRMPPIEGPIPSSGITALPQSVIEFKAQSNRPLSGGELEITTAAGTERIPLTAAGGAAEAKGSFTLTAAGGGGKLVLRVKDAEGQSSTDAFSTTLTLLEDQRPLVRIVEPRSQSFATPSARLPVSLMAEDDFGLTAITLYRSLNDSRAMGLDLPVDPKGPNRQRADMTLNLAPLGLKPGDVIRLVGRAQDNDPAGAKGAESPSSSIQIISQEDYNRMMVARAGLELLLSKYQEAQRHMEAVEAKLRKMKEELAKSPETNPLSQDQKKDAENAAEAAAHAAEEVERAREVSLPFDIDKAMTPRLERISQRLTTVANKVGEGAANPDATVKDQLKILDDLIKGVDDEEQQFAQEVLEPLDYLAKIFPLIADQAKFVQLYKRQAGLAERVAAMKDDAANDPREKLRFKDMEFEQKQLVENLKTLLADIKSHVAQIPEDPRLDEFRRTADAFHKKLRESPVEEIMIYAQVSFAEALIDSARTNTAEAAEALAKFIAEGEGGGMGQGAEGAIVFQPSLAKNLGKTIAQLLGAAGLGGGSGFSMDAQSADNVGVYGNLPIGTPNRSGNSPAGAGVAGGTVAPDGTPMTGTVANQVRGASGAAAVPIPDQYRRRVDQYFRRVADEITKE